MADTILVIAPHPDDETLGCGGTLLRHRCEGDAIHWIIVTGMTSGGAFPAERIISRQREISAVAECYGFSSVHRLDFPTTRLDTVPQGDLVTSIKSIFEKVSPTIVYVPFRGDAHTDHAIVFDAAAACTKWFRQPSVKKILVYETPSETEFGMNPDGIRFQPNVFVDIKEHLEKKLAILDHYEGEMGIFPFPRSKEAIRALATWRGASAGCLAAEAFMLVKEIL